MNENARALRDAWNTSTGDAGVDALLRMSLAAHASQDPGQVPMLRTLELAGRSQLDLHVEGARESSHETRAGALGQFMIRVSNAVRAVARSASGLERIWGDINVLAPAPGSVRVVFVEQKDRPPGQSDRRSDEAWARGLERVASTFELAAEGRDELDALLLDLDGRSRHALKMLGQTVEENDWGLEGALITRSGERRDVSLSTSAARRLVDATDRRATREYPVEAPGVVDGWRWSTSTMRLVLDRGAAIEAYVPGDLRFLVAEANAHPGLRVDAKFKVIETAGGGSSTRARRVFTLESLEVEPSLLDSVRRDWPDVEA